jgi:hypothetical protein
MKDKQINYRASKSEYRALLLAAKSTRLPISFLIRECVTAHLPKMVKRITGAA